MQSSNILGILNKIPLFNGLSEKELKVILSICKPLKMGENELLFNEGDASHDLYILLSGSINLDTRKSGKIFTLNSCDIFGEIGLITQRTRSASATCMEPCSLLSIHHVDFNMLAGKHPRISSILMRNISTNLANHVVRMNQSSLEHIPEETKTGTMQTEKQILSSTPK